MSGRTEHWSCVHIISAWLNTPCTWRRHQMETLSVLLAFCARSSVNSPHEGQWRGALMFSLICAWINGWVNNRDAGDLRRQLAHYDVIMMHTSQYGWHSDITSTPHLTANTSHNHQLLSTTDSPTRERSAGKHLPYSPTTRNTYIDPLLRQLCMYDVEHSIVWPTVWKKHIIRKELYKL